MCDPDTKTISILKFMGGDGLTVLLIHEICRGVKDAYCAEHNMPSPPPITGNGGGNGWSGQPSRPRAWEWLR